MAQKLEGSIIILFLIAIGVGIIGWGSPAPSTPLAGACSTTNTKCVNAVGVSNGVLCALSAAGAGGSFFTGTFFTYAAKINGNLSFSAQIQAVSNITGLVMQYQIRQSASQGTQSCGTVANSLQGTQIDSGAFNYPITGIGLSSTLSFKQNGVAIGTAYNYFLVAKFITVPAPALLTVQSGFATNIVAIET